MAVRQKRPAYRRWGREQQRVPGQDGVIARSAVPMARRLAWMMSPRPWLGGWRRYRCRGCASMAKPHQPIGRLVTCRSFRLVLRFLVPPGLPATPCLTDKKDPLRRKESDRMEPSGFEPLTPCMPCRCSTS